MTIQERIAKIHVGHAAFPSNGGLIECACGFIMFTVTEHAAHVAEVLTTELGLTQQWGSSDPGLSDDEPAGWYEQADDLDAEAEARSMQKSWGGKLFTRYATSWESV